MTGNLSGMINYQEGAVVSRALVNKETGTITLFAFDEDQGLSEHKTPYDAFVHIVEGKAEITISGKPHVLEENDFIIMPANEPHAVKALTRFKMLLTMIKSA